MQTQQSVDMYHTPQCVIGVHDDSRPTWLNITDSRSAVLIIFVKINIRRLKFIERKTLARDYTMSCMLCFSCSMLCVVYM